MKASFVFAAAAVLVLSTATLASAGSVVFIGDSMTEFAKTTMNTYCQGSTSTNLGIGGTTAAQWATATDGDMNVATAVVKDGTCYDYVWVSLGGNDGLNTQCTATSETVTSSIGTVLTKVNTACPDSKIVMTGYCTPTACFSECPQGSWAAVNYMNGYVKSACDANSACTYVDITNICGGTNNNPSSGAFHVDVIHMNEAGYCKMWSMSEIQTAFGCTGTTSCPTSTGYCTDGSSSSSNGAPPSTPMATTSTQIVMAAVSAAVLVGASKNLLL